MRLDTKAYWLTDRQSQCDFEFDFDFDFDFENQVVKRRLGSWCEMAASVEVVGYQLLVSSEREAMEIGPERGKLKYLHC
jgi:hypothetical protein